MVDYSEFGQFESACYAWIRRFGLTDWNVEVRFAPLGDCDENVRARCLTNWVQRSAAIVFNSGWRARGDQVAGETLDALALHEVSHLLLSTLVNLCAEQRDAYCNPVDSEEHAVIRKLQRALLPQPDA